MRMPRNIAALFIDSLALFQLAPHMAQFDIVALKPRDQKALDVSSIDDRNKILVKLKIFIYLRLLISKSKKFIFLKVLKGTRISARLGSSW